MLPKKEIARLDEMIGSLMIKQFKDQEEYRKAISLIIKAFFDGLHVKGDYKESKN